MIKLLKGLLPKKWKETFHDYILSIARQENLRQVEPLEKRLNNLQLHLENVSSLVNSTTDNLETVGENLKGIHLSLISNIDHLKEEQLQIHQELSKIEMANLVIYHLLPEVLYFDVETRKLVEDFNKQYGVDFAYPQEISKNDIMFLYSLATYKKVPIACHNYFTIGYNGFSIIRDFISHIYTPNKFQGRILDFASGYGRVTRFLASYYGADKITTSDIKSEAVDFQQHYFKVNGLYSTYVPAEFKSESSFDLIFVGSLFSHLNETLFFEWLSKLISLLSETGHLLFTVHDQSLHPQVHDKDFVYVENNEDEKFEFIQNRITSTSLYGISFVSESYVKAILNKINPKVQYKRYPKTFGGHQDLYIATVGGKLPATDFTFTM